MIGGAFAAGAVIASRSLRAQQLQTYLPPGVAPKPKGPLVYGEYDQEELDFAYDQIPWAPNFDAVLLERLPARNAATLARIDPPRRLSYGPTEIEKLDLYTSQQTNAPIHVHIHGGAWRGGAASDMAFLSEMFVDAGACVFHGSRSLIPREGGKPFHVIPVTRSTRSRSVSERSDVGHGHLL